MKTKPETGAFTFLELLVVITVTAMLAALVLPSLGMSKSSGQGAMCLSNLRQLTAAWMTYTSDNRGRLVPNGDETSQPNGPTDPSALPGGPLAQWCPGRQDMATDLSPSNQSTGTNIGDEWIHLGLLYSYINNYGVYKCPADVNSISAFGLIYPHVRSVSMNTWLGPIAPYNDDASVESYYKDSDLVRPGPSQHFVFIDENPVGINDASIIFTPDIAQWVDCPASYHNGGGGISFADGHAQIKRWTDQTVLTEWNSTIQPGNPAFTRLPPQQNPPRDLTFMQNASTYIK